MPLVKKIAFDEPIAGVNARFDLEHVLRPVAAAHSTDGTVFDPHNIRSLQGIAYGRGKCPVESGEQFTIDCVECSATFLVGDVVETGFVWSAQVRSNGRFGALA